MKDSENCSRADQHTPAPEGYMAWQDWARRMSKTHTQVICDGCLKYKIWIPKDVAPQPVIETCATCLVSEGQER
jgi:hypothetical protein